MKPAGLETVFFCVALPPPIQGHAVVSSAILERLKLFGGTNIVVHDIAPKVCKNRLVYHWSRISSVLLAAIRIIIEGRASNSIAYLVLESGGGILYNFILIGVCKFKRVNFVLHHHTAAHTKFFQTRFDILRKFAGQRCTHVVLTENMLHDLQNLYPGLAKVIVCGNAFLVDPGPTPSSKQSVTRLGFLSNLTVDKGTLEVLSCFSQMRALGFDVHLTIAGPINEAEVENAVRTMQRICPTTFDYIGAISGVSKVDFFSNIDVFLFPSTYRNEAQPLVILEALSYSRVVIASTAGYIAEMLPADWTTALDDSKFSTVVAGLLIQLRSEGPCPSSASDQAKHHFESSRAKSEEQLNELLRILARKATE
jgi:glycosyltransferase involved in cell wall biosynthesis